MKIGQFDFRPRLLPSLVTLLLLPLLISLGNWQLRRAEEKRELQVTLNERAEQAEVRLKPAHGQGRDMLFRKVIVQGTMLGERQYLLDNQINKGRVGYHVYTPVRIRGGAMLVLVNRGWLAGSPHRGQLPDVALPDAVSHGDGGLRGILSDPPGKLLQLAGQDAELQRAAAWPRRVQGIELARIERELGEPLLPYIVQIAADDPAALVQEWHPYVDKPQKHVSYAVQWFTMAVVLILIFVALNTRRLKKD